MLWLEVIGCRMRNAGPRWLVIRSAFLEIKLTGPMLLLAWRGGRGIRGQRDLRVLVAATTRTGGRIFGIFVHDNLHLAASGLVRLRKSDKRLWREPETQRLVCGAQ